MNELNKQNKFMDYSNDDLINMVNNGHSQVEGFLQASVNVAAEVGTCLIELKHRISHDQWLSFIDKHFISGPNKIQNYMLWALDPNPKLNSYLNKRVSIKKGIALISESENPSFEAEQNYLCTLYEDLGIRKLPEYPTYKPEDSDEDIKGKNGKILYINSFVALLWKTWIFGKKEYGANSWEKTMDDYDNFRGYISDVEDREILFCFVNDVEKKLKLKQLSKIEILKMSSREIAELILRTV